MPKFIMQYGESESTFECTDLIEARKCVAKWVRDSDWFESDETFWVKVNITSEDGLEDTFTVAINPTVPSCTNEHNHDWQSPYEIVGGCKENPGVFGHGGGVIIKEYCINCGCKRITNTWAQDRSTGEQGLHSVSYKQFED